MARAVGINHVALEVGDLDAAVELYGAVLGMPLRGRVPGMAFLDMGDQFLTLSESAAASERRDTERHFGLVVDDKEAVRAALRDAGVEFLPQAGDLDFRDPWGNHVQVVDYREVQFAKTGAALRALGLEGLQKSEQALREMRDKGLL